MSLTTKSFKLALGDFLLLAFSKNSSGRNMWVFFVVDPFWGRFRGATDVLAEAIRTNIRGQSLQDSRQFGRIEQSEVCCPFRLGNGNHHPVVGSSHFARQIVARESFAFCFVAVGRVPKRFTTLVTL